MKCSPTDSEVFALLAVLTHHQLSAHPLTGGEMELILFFIPNACFYITLMLLCVGCIQQT